MIGDRQETVEPRLVGVPDVSERTSFGGERDPVRPATIPSWLGVVGIVFVLTSLVSVLRFQTAAQFGITLICWAAVGLLIWERRSRLVLSTSVPAVLLGSLFLGAAWSSVLWMTEAREQWLHLCPLVGFLGLTLLASRFRGIAQYWRELTILFTLGVPRGFISDWVDLSTATAKVASSILWYLGRDVRLVGTEIVLPGGSVNVNKGCDGTGVMSYLLCLAVVFIFLFPVKGARRWWALAVAVALAFVTNMTRVVTLALMEAAGHHEAFEYWHAGSGSILWTVLPVLLFSVVGMLLLPKSKTTDAIS